MFKNLSFTLLGCYFSVRVRVRDEPEHELRSENGEA
jgi:hypothetical protein